MLVGLNVYFLSGQIKEFKDELKENSRETEEQIGRLVVRQTSQKAVI